MSDTTRRSTHDAEGQRNDRRREERDSEHGSSRPDGRHRSHGDEHRSSGDRRHDSRRNGDDGKERKRSRSRSPPRDDARGEGHRRSRHRSRSPERRTDRDDKERDTERKGKYHPSSSSRSHRHRDEDRRRRRSRSRSRSSDRSSSDSESDGSQRHRKDRRKSGGGSSGGRHHRSSRHRDETESEREERRRRKKEKRDKKDKVSPLPRALQVQVVVPDTYLTHVQKDRKKKGLATIEWGKHGILTETDIYQKDQEFRAWLVGERMLNPETMSKAKEKEIFKEFMEDFNTGTLPHEKYYNMDKYEARATIRASHRRVPTQTETFLDKSRLEALARVQRERVEAERMKKLGMKVAENFGVITQTKEEAKRGGK